MEIRPVEKETFIRALIESHQALVDFVSALPPEERTQPGAAGNWSVKDILAHMAMWEAEIIKTLFQARRVSKPSTVLFKKISDDDQNALWYAQFKDRSFERVWGDFTIIRDQTIRQVQEYSQEELNNPNLYPWLKGKTTLAGLVTTGILDHDQEHLRALRAWKQNRS
ncbi:MAG: DinB family protein [Bellilinea sp.]